MLAAGTRVGPYEIIAHIGAGAMGEVYRARDTRIGRDIAIKILPQHLMDPVHRSRFVQEARAAGALNHENVVAVFDVGENYIVTELVEGESLRNVICRGPVSVRRALDLSAQIAAGLAAAHRARIIHRDLKPENIMLTRDGRIKILDFGLAKPIATAIPDDFTVTMNQLTDDGMVVGTASYMSPEQIRAHAVDHRSDIFAFGVILHELVAGERPFRGTSSVDVMNAILNQEPPELPANTPLDVQRIVRRCLNKDPEQRFQCSSDLAFALTSLVHMSESANLPARNSRSILVRSFTLAAIAIALSIAFIVALKLQRPRSVGIPTVRYLTYSGHDSSPSVSPDGRTVAFVSSRDGTQRIWIKQLNAGSEVALTAGPDAAPRYSPDGSMLLFLRAEPTGLSLYRTPAVAPEPRRVLHNVSSADWSPDGRRIVYIRWETDGSRTHSLIGIVDVNGNDHGPIARAQNQRLIHPRWSPDGREIAAVATFFSSTLPEPVTLISTSTGTLRHLKVPANGFGMSAVTWNGRDHLVYAIADSAAGGFVGNSSAPSWFIAHDVLDGATRRLYWSPYGAHIVDTAGAGRLLYDTKSPRESLREVTLGSAYSRWLTRGASNDRQPSYSPDGERILFSSNRSGNLDVWEVLPGTGAVRRLTDHAAEDWDPVYALNGRKILWSSARAGHFEIWMADADGSNGRQVTADGVDAQNPTITPDGQWIIYASANQKHPGLWKIRPNGSDATRLVAANVALPEISPNGLYIAYTVVNLQDRVDVRFCRIQDGGSAAPDIPIRIRSEGSSGSVGRLRWAPDSQRIFFVGQNETGVNGLYSQGFTPGTDTSATRREFCCFDSEFATESFGISPDGKRVSIASWEQVENLVIADAVAGITERYNSGVRP